MARNGTGIFAVLNPILIGALRSSSAVNQDFTDMGTEITNTIPLTGVAGMSGQFKAANGTTASPGLGFGSDQNSGFRRAAVDEMRWVGGGQDRFYVDANGKAWHLAAAAVSGASVIHGAFSGSGSDLPAIEALTGNGLLRRTAANTFSLDNVTVPVSYVFDGKTSNLHVGQAVDLAIPFAGIITGAKLLANAAGSCSVNIFKATYSAFPTISTSIVSATPPTLTAATSYSDTTLSGWTTSVAADDIVRFSLTSISGITRLAVTLSVTRYN